MASICAPEVGRGGGAGERLHDKYRAEQGSAALCEPEVNSDHMRRGQCCLQQTATAVSAGVLAMWQVAR
eukprot:350422-Chlamydomonas_euryale.AAC.6